MTELKILIDFEKPFNEQFFKSIGLNIEFNEYHDGFDIYKPDDEKTHIYGFYYEEYDCIYSIYPGRCEGNWLELLKYIDKHNTINIYHEEFDFSSSYENWTEEEYNKNLINAIKDCRKKLNLN